MPRQALQCRSTLRRAGPKRPNSATWRRLWALATLALLLVTSSAHAEAIALLRKAGSAELADARFARESGLQIEAVTVEFQCESTGFDLATTRSGHRCRKEQVAVLVNRSEAAVDLVGRACGPCVGRWCTHFQGSPVAEIDLDDRDSEDLAAQMRRLTGEPGGGGVALYACDGIAVKLPPGGRLEIRSRSGYFDANFAEPAFDDSCRLSRSGASGAVSSVPGFAVRHPLLHTSVACATIADFAVDARWLQLYRGDAVVAGRMRHANGLAASAVGSRPAALQTSDGEATLLVGVGPTCNANSHCDPAGQAAIRLTRPGTWLRNGGPTVAFGSTRHDGNADRLRIGYDVGFGQSVAMGSLHLDMSVTGPRRLVLTPSVSLLLPLAIAPPLFLLPSLALGVGAPVQVVPEPRVGVRLLADATLLSVGFVVAGDYFGAAAQQPGEWRYSLLFTAGL